MTSNDNGDCRHGLMRNEDENEGSDAQLGDFAGTELDEEGPLVAPMDIVWEETEERPDDDFILIWGEHYHYEHLEVEREQYATLTMLMDTENENDEISLDLSEATSDGEGNTRNLPEGEGGAFEDTYMSPALMAVATGDWVPETVYTDDSDQ